MEVMDNEKFIAIEFTDVGLGCLMTISQVETVYKLLSERILNLRNEFDLYGLMQPSSSARELFHNFFSIGVGCISM